MVGQACWKRLAMSLDGTTPPRNQTVRRIWRRDGCAKAVKTSSSSASCSRTSPTSSALERRELVDLQFLEQRRHGLPDFHDFRRLVRQLGALLVLPAEELDVARRAFTKVLGLPS